ncbi:hypothetical protein M1D80_08100 [Phyllobacteriaceae bacterium JZ32]
MADSNKLAGSPSHFASTGHDARRPSEVVRLSALRSCAGERTGQQYLPTSGKDLPAEIDDAILKIARVLARQAAREDHARQEVGSACHDETRGNLREILNRSAK